MNHIAKFVAWILAYVSILDMSWGHVYAELGWLNMNPALWANYSTVGDIIIGSVAGIAGIWLLQERIVDFVKEIA